MDAKFLSKLITEDLMGSRFVRIHEPFKFFSKILNCEIEIPPGFICDFESVPLFKASSKRGGVLHDYLCRKDSIPLVTKQEAASVYLEAQKARDIALNEGWFKRLDRWCRRNVKTLVVRVAPGYFHRLNVLASLDEVKKTV